MKRDQYSPITNYIPITNQQAMDFIEKLQPSKGAPNMWRITFTTETDKQMHEIQLAVEVQTKKGEIDFAFETKIEELGVQFDDEDEL